MFSHDIRYSFRTFFKNPGFTAAIILTLALGIGGNTAIFSVVNGVLLRPLEYSHADRILTLWNSYGPDFSHAAISAPEYFDLKEGLRMFDAVAAMRPQRLTLASGGDPESIAALTVTPNFFDLLGETPVLGRGFQNGDGMPDSEPVLILSHALWSRRFGSAPEIVGDQVNIGGRIHTVVGVLPSGMGFPEAPLGFIRDRADVFMPSTFERARTGSRGNQNMGVLARVREGASKPDAAADLSAIEGRFKAEFARRYAPPAVPNWSILAVPLRDEMTGSAKPALLIITLAVGLVLFIVCINVANLLLARGAERHRELAVRIALGATRMRLFRQMLSESVLLAGAGGLGGILIVYTGIPALMQLDSGNIPLLDHIRIDGWVLGFSLTLSLFTGVLIGIFPALQQSSPNPSSSMNDASRGSSESSGPRRLRAVLASAQVAMAVVVLIAAGLLGRTFAALTRVDPGFSSGGVLSMQLTLPQLQYDTEEKRAAFMEQLQQSMVAIPAASAASAVYPLPMSGQGWSGTLTVEGEPTGPDVQLPHAEYAVAMPGYFQVMRIALLAGRDFTRADRIEAPKVVIVDERLAQRHWPNQTAIGKRINAGGQPGDWATVVGVVRHVYNSGPHSEGEPQLYLPYLQSPQAPIFIVTRTDKDTLSMVAGMRATVREMDPGLPVSRIDRMEDLVSKAVAAPRFNTTMLGVFALVALGIVCTGLYGAMSYVVARRTHEIGIRIALGGSPREVRQMVLGESLLIVAAGLFIGSLASLTLSRLLSGLLYGVEPTDPATYAGTIAILLLVSIIASYGPARRATRIDPVVALRN